MKNSGGRAGASRVRPILIGALSVLVVALVVAGLVAPNIVSMPLTVRTGVTDPGPDPGRAAPPVTGPGMAGPGTAGPGRSRPMVVRTDTTTATPVFGTVGVDGGLAVGTVRFSLAPSVSPLGAVEWTLDGANHYRVEAPVIAGEYQITVTATVDGEEHTEHASVTLEPGQSLEISTMISSAPWLVFFLPIPAY